VWPDVSLKRDELRSKVYGKFGHDIDGNRRHPPGDYPLQKIPPEVTSVCQLGSVIPPRGADRVRSTVNITVQIFALRMLLQSVQSGAGYLRGNFL